MFFKTVPLDAFSLGFYNATRRVIDYHRAMALKIRMARGGAKKRPFYRIVVAEATSPRDGRFVERIGHYDPFLEHSDANRVVMNLDRARYWLSQGAKPSERVALFLAKAGILPETQPTERPKKSAPKKKAQERMKAEAERAAAGAAEAGE